MYNNNKKIIDLFSGCGGFALGFHKAGFNTFLAADSDLHSCNTFKSNFKKIRNRRLKYLAAITGNSLKSFDLSLKSLFLSKQNLGSIFLFSFTSNFNKSSHSKSRADRVINQVGGPKLIISAN